MNCGIGDDQVEHVLRNAHNLPVVKSVKEVVVLCDTNNLDQDSTEDITDGVIEVASDFKFKYGYISISICGIFPRDYNWIKIGCILKRSIIFYKKMPPVVFCFYLSRQRLDSLKWFFLLLELNLLPHIRLQILDFLRLQSHFGTYDIFLYHQNFVWF